MDFSDSYLGEIGLWTGDFIPHGWAACNGQLLSVTDNLALFALLGTTYGGDGKKTFGLPDLQGRTPVGITTAAGDYALGAKGGAEQVTLTEATMPSHGHDVWATDALANSEPPLDAIPAKVNGTVNKYFVGAPDVAIADDSLAASGNGMPHDNLQPSLALTYVICIDGFFPTLK